jgi:(4S)-4-hydroxy-5-phosphonooxypentane-2,3-dione isomerase
MYVVCVHLHVQPDNCDEFMALTLENARHTVEEPGNLRFDVLRQADDPERFVLYEVYREESDMQAHKQTPHYAQWAAGVPELLVEPRCSVRYTALFPDEAKRWSSR